MINNLTKVHPTELGGFRIEIRLKARTLNQARVNSKEPPLLQHRQLVESNRGRDKALQTGSNGDHQGGLTPKCRPNAGHCNSRDIWSDANQGKVSRYRQQIVTDLFAASGWNPGRRGLTRSNKSGAWWREPDDGSKRTAWEIILGHLTAKYSASAWLHRLFEVMQRHMINGVLPCQKNGRGVHG